MGAIDNSVKQHMKLMLHYGPQYMINSDEEACVKLTAAGVKSFNTMEGRSTNGLRSMKAVITIISDVQWTSCFYISRDLRGRPQRLYIQNHLKKE